MKLDEILKEAPFYDEPERDLAGEYDETDPERHVDRDWDDYDDSLDDEGDRFRVDNDYQPDPDEEQAIQRERDQRNSAAERFRQSLGRGRMFAKDRR